MNAVVIVTHSTSFFIEHQLNRIQNLCVDPVEILIIDNTPPEKSSISNEIFHTTQEYQATFAKTNYQHACGSFSHAPALNEGFREIKKRGFNRLLILDHDVIPFKKFHIESNYALEGLLQHRGKISYMCPAYINIDLNKIPQMDFLPTHIKGESTDTGGQLHHHIERLGQREVRGIKQEHRHQGTDRFHEILDTKMFHFIRGSNWGIPESPALTEEQNKLKLQKLSQEFNILSRDYKLA